MSEDWNVGTDNGPIVRGPQPMSTVVTLGNTRLDGVERVDTDSDRSGGTRHLGSRPQS